MTFAVPALLLAAAGVGAGHAALPDHWVPLSVTARAQNHSRGRVLRTAATAGVVHVALSLVLGGIVIAVGVQFRSVIERNQSLVVGGILIATGLAFGIVEFVGRGHGHSHDHAHHHGHEHHHGDAGAHLHPHGDDRRNGGSPATGWGRFAGLASFAAAASPDLTILPVFLAASALGGAAAVGTLVTFSIGTVATMVGLTMLGAAAAQRLQSAWLDRFANLLTAAVLIVIGALIAVAVL
ncbi:hypothetical protein FK529_04295 [Tsukamurella asaccharolytica]|uniref:Urease accessory protein UreH-like transmembrane domain-containing protein n=1 Tax=Tsukamurella asaccharolytica TaxID=2592067 RepID=A0A5C5REQ4_9ACTN|nr:hypothetical protein [Tsukamurella asaccharolytica]TWS20571.1 hypothetical protein FK529_04295 [Tsukamurella asaccharolytica]